MYFTHLPVGILQQVALHPMEDAGRAVAEGSGMLSDAGAAPPGLHPVERHLPIGNERRKHPHGIGAASHTGHHRIGQPPFQLQVLRPGLGADHRLEIPHHQRIRMGPHHRADAVKSIFHVRHPITDRFIDGILQCTAAAMHRYNGSPEQLHPEYIETLPGDIGFAHVDKTGQSELGGHRGGSDSMLPGAGLGDDALLAHAPGQQQLPDHVVDLVRTGMIEILPLEIDLRAAQFGVEAVGQGQRIGAAGVFLQIIVEGLVKTGIIPHLEIMRL